VTKYIDPELKYCPKCGDEYIPERDDCAACNIELLSGARLLELQEEQRRQRDERSRAITAEDKVVGIRKGTVFDMKQWQARLEREGFPSLLVKDDQGCGSKCGGSDVVLQVRESDGQAVARIFSLDHLHSTGLKDHDITHVDAVFHADAEDTVCPACGITFSTSSTECPDCGLCFA